MTIVKNINFSEQMEQEAIVAAQQGFDNFDDVKTVAEFILAQMDSKYPVNFHCIGCKSSENPEGVDYSDQYLCFNFGDFTFHLWFDQGVLESTPQPEYQPMFKSTEEKRDTKEFDPISLFSKYDKSGNGKLEFDEFLKFMVEGLKYEPRNDTGNNFYKQMRFIYDGMDIDGSHNLDQKEVIDCLTKLKQGDIKWITKMIFRGADVDKSRKVPVYELSDASKTFMVDFSSRCEMEFGRKKKELEYWEYYKVVTGEQLDTKSIDADPYDGKLPQKSKCCLLI